MSNLTEEELRLEELKDEANSLGITYSSRIGADKLAEKIEEYYAAQETSGPALQAQVAQKEANESVTVSGKTNSRAAFIAKRKAEAKKLRVVTIVDNDQRVNNHTDTCIANCSNEYFDLGTKIFPLNTPVEVAQGHIDTLKEVKITLHVRDPKTGLCNTKYRPRYTISYEDQK